jgi:hypothetical protein
MSGDQIFALLFVGMFILAGLFWGLADILASRRRPPTTPPPLWRSSSTTTRRAPDDLDWEQEQREARDSKRNGS